MAYESPVAEDARIDVGALVGAIVRKLPRIILVTVLFLAAAFVFLMFQPRLYDSSASILVEPRSNPYVRASGEQAPQWGNNAAGVISSQIELVKSRDTLLKVIDQLGLRSVAEFNGSGEAPGPLSIITSVISRNPTAPTSLDEIVLGNLYDKLVVAQERDSAVISVQVSSQDPQLAADIANAIAAAHVARRAELSLSDTAEASTWLGDEIARLRVAVEEAESKVANFRVENDLLAVGAGNVGLLDQQLSTVNAQISAAQERKNAAESRAALIRGLLERNQPIEGVAGVRDTPAIQQLSQEKARLQGELAQRSATLLSNHPTIRALNAQIGEINAQIRNEGQRVASALEAEAQIEQSLEDSLRADLARAKATASTATRDTVTLDSLQREAKAQRDLLEAYLQRYNEASSRVGAESELPDVRVISVAAPAVAPSSPKSTLVMMAVGLASVALQLGAAAFSELMSGRALVPVRAAPRPQDELEEMPFDETELEPDQKWEEPAEEIAAEQGSDPVVSFDPPAPEVVAEPEPQPIHEAAPVHAPEPVVEPVSAPVVAEASADPEPDPEAARAFIGSLMATPAPAAPVDDFDDEEEYEPLVEQEPELVADIEEPSVFADEPPVFAEEPIIPPVRRPVVSRENGPRLLRFSDLVSDLVLGRTHLLLLADHGNDMAGRAFAEELCADALAKGLSVALIDAGTGERTDAPGITDLSLGDASFGDVVQKSADNSFAEVSWGRGDAIDLTSTRPLTLAEALRDIYEVVVVLTGKVGRNSSLISFAELGGRIVLVTADQEDAIGAEVTRRTLEANGLPRVEISALELIAA